MRWYVDLTITSLRESVLFSVGCAAAALFGEILFGVPFTDGLGLVLLIVGATMMLVGGAMSFVTPGSVKLMNTLLSAFTGKVRASPGTYDYNKTQHSAAIYTATGVLLFAYSLMLGLILG